jgi:flagellar hook-associated protein 3 FlgL
MRIATYQSLQTSVDNLQARYQTLAATQAQLTSGQRVRQPGDDPAAAARAVRALAAESQIGAQTAALNASQSNMQLAESTLGDAATLLQQARSLVVSAGNAGQSDSDRASIVQQLQGIRAQLLTLANSTDGNGRYVFDGQGSDTPPFVEDTQGVRYVGVGGRQQVDGSQPMPMTADGSFAWMQASDPANPANTLSVFDAMDQTIVALGKTGQSSDEIAQAVSQGIAGIDSVNDRILSAQAAAGATLQDATNVGNRLSQGMLDAQSRQSNAQDLDMVQGISDFQNQQTAYQAALKTYSMIQQMSLFNYVNP